MWTGQSHPLSARGALRSGLTVAQVHLGPESNRALPKALGGNVQARRGQWAGSGWDLPRLDGLGPGFPASQAAQCPRAGGDPRGAPKAAQARAPPGLVNQPGAVVTELNAVPYLFVVFRGTEWFVLVLASWQRGSGQRGRRPHRRAHRQGRCPLPAMRGVFGGWGGAPQVFPQGPGHQLQGSDRDPAVRPQPDSGAESCRERSALSWVGTAPRGGLGCHQHLQGSRVGGEAPGARTAAVYRHSTPLRGLAWAAKG